MSTWRVRHERPPSPILLLAVLGVLSGLLLATGGCAPKKGPLFTAPVPGVESWGQPVPFEDAAGACEVETVYAGEPVDQVREGMARCGGTLVPDSVLHDLEQETKRADHYERVAEDQYAGRVRDRELVAQPALEREREYSAQLHAQVTVGRWTVVGLTMAIPVAAALAYWAGFRTGGVVFGAGGVALRVEWGSGE